MVAEQLVWGYVLLVVIRLVLVDVKLPVVVTLASLDVRLVALVLVELDAPIVVLENVKVGAKVPVKLDVKTGVKLLVPEDVPDVPQVVRFLVIMFAKQNA